MDPQELHRLYCLHTEQAVPLNMGRIYQWEVWSARDLTEKDLVDVIRYLRSEIREGRRNVGALKFSNLIGEPDRFEEDLALLRAQQRPRAPKTQTVRTGETERIVPNPNTGNTSEPARVPMGRVIEELRKATEPNG